MLHKIALACTILMGSAVMLGCQAPEEDSCNIKTPGVFVEYEVHEEGGSAATRATFWVGDKPGGTFLSFGSCGDSIAVNGKTLTKVSAGDHDAYETSMTAVDSYEFIFSRDGETPYSSAVAPRNPVAITAPAGNASVSRAAAFDITWDANDSGSLNLLVSGDCIKDFPSTLGESVTDNGTYAVNANGIEPFVSSDSGKSCTATLELNRQNTGTLSSSLKGTIEGNSLAHASFTSAP